MGETNERRVTPLLHVISALCFILEILLGFHPIARALKRQEIPCHEYLLSCSLFSCSSLLSHLSHLSSSLPPLLPDWSKLLPTNKAIPIYKNSSHNKLINSMFPLTQLAHLFSFNHDDPFSFERNILPLWYQFTLILALTCPLLYLTHRVPYRPFLALITCFANFCSYTEPYNLARPIYVCFYPVKGETFHHPEERRLRTQ